MWEFWKLVNINWTINTQSPFKLAILRKILPLHTDCSNIFYSILFSKNKIWIIFSWFYFMCYFMIHFNDFCYPLNTYSFLWKVFMHLNFIRNNFSQTQNLSNKIRSIKMFLNLRQSKVCTMPARQKLTKQISRNWFCIILYELL